jgi:creatinine amidohydrolase
MRIPRTARPSVLRIAALVSGLSALQSHPVVAQIYNVQEMNTDQIVALDRAKTVVLIPVGNLEEHGPYLPSYTDGYQSEYLARRLASAIASRPGWSVLNFPPVPLGVASAQNIGGKLHFPGAYDVRESTFRAVFVDLAVNLGEQGFRWAFVVDSHGAPSHHRALDQAGDYFRATYGGRMVSLNGLVPVENSAAGVGAARSQAFRDENGFDVHAGANEHSYLLFLQPDLVHPGFQNAKPLTARSWADLWQIARADDWPGYFGSPRLASREYGEARMQARATVMTDYALKILDGLDERTVPRRTGSSGFTAGLTILWITAALGLMWLILTARAIFTFPRWTRRIVAGGHTTLRLVLEHVLPAFVGVAVSILILQGLPYVRFTPSLLRLPPYPDYLLAVLAFVTITVAVLRLGIVLRAVVRSRSKHVLEDRHA